MKNLQLKGALNFQIALAQARIGDEEKAIKPAN
jgi:hypothetical protein